MTLNCLHLHPNPQCSSYVHSKHSLLRDFHQFETWEPDRMSPINFSSQSSGNCTTGSRCSFLVGQAHAPFRIMPSSYCVGASSKQYWTFYCSNSATTVNLWKIIILLSQ